MNQCRDQDLLRLQPDGSSTAFWASIEKAIGALAKVILGINLGAVGLCALGDAMHRLGFTNLLWWAGVGTTWSVWALVGIWQYQHNRSSLKAYLRLGQVAMWSLALTCATSTWSLTYITGTYTYYASHWMMIVALFVSVYAVLACYLTIGWKRSRERFRALSAYRTAGRLRTTEFRVIWFSQARSMRWAERAPLLIGVSIPIWIIAAIVIQVGTGKDPREFLSHVLLLCISVYAMSFMTAALWHQRHYLGDADLVIVD